MPRVADIQDMDTLRDVALLLERESERQAKALAALREELAIAQGRTLSQVELKHLYLKELLEQREEALFGESTEKRHHSASASQRKSELDAHMRAQTGHGPRHQPELAAIDQVHELEQDERQCGACGGELQPMGEAQVKTAKKSLSSNVTSCWCDIDVASTVASATVVSRQRLGRSNSFEADAIRPISPSMLRWANI